MCLAHLRRHFQRLTKLSGQENQAIGQTFIDLIDEAFDAHGQWRQTQDDSSYRYWAVKFQAKVELTITTWKVNYEETIISGFRRSLPE